MAAEVYWTSAGDLVVSGNKRVALGTITCSGLASGACAIPGMKKIDCVTLAPKVLGAATFAVAVNEGSGATAMNGWVHIKSATASDVFFATVWGR